MLGLMGRKLGMTQVYDERGEAVPVTLIEVGPCTITQVKTEAKDGYAAVQLGFGEKRPSRMTKAVVGHFTKNGLTPTRWLREFRVEAGGEHAVGQSIDVTLFAVGQKVDVVGTSIGRGFQGVVKRHGFTGGKATHGVTTHDQPGSIGASAFPSRVIKGKRLPGRMGGGPVTLRKLRVVAIDPEQNTMAVCGAVPGPRRGLLMIRPSKPTARDKKRPAPAAKK
jgi:large subunit ribosomal protein L3